MSCFIQNYGINKHCKLLLLKKYSLYWLELVAIEVVVSDQLVIAWYDRLSNQIECEKCSALLYSESVVSKVITWDMNCVYILGTLGLKDCRLLYFTLRMSFQLDWFELEGIYDTGTKSLICVVQVLWNMILMQTY